MKKVLDADFKLLKPIGKNKKGKIFKSFGGIVSGVEGIAFSNKEFFKPINIRYEKSYSI